MYSVVLMAALTAGSATPDCHWRGCCGWGWGCGCYGGYGYGCCGCYGGCFGCWGGWGGCFGCWGGYAGWGCLGGYGGGYYYGAPTYPGTVAPGGGMGAPPQYGEPLPTPAEEKKKDKGKDGTLLPANKAKLIVTLPANAKLFIDDLPMKNAVGTRSFNTPSLEPGQAYYYMVRVETVRDGKTISETRRVIVRAGQVARADFRDLESDAVRTAQAK